MTVDDDGVWLGEPWPVLGVPPGLVVGFVVVGGELGVEVGVRVGLCWPGFPLGPPVPGLP